MAEQLAVSSDMGFSRLVFDKLGETLENFHSHALPILSLSKQLEDLDSLLKVENFDSVVECEKCRDISERGRGVGLREEELNELSRKLVSKEEQLKKEFKACCEEMRLKKVKLMESCGLQRKEIESKLDEMGLRWKDLEAKEAEIKAGLEGLRCRETGIEARLEELRNKEEEIKAGLEELGWQEKEIKAEWEELRCTETGIEASLEELRRKEEEIEAGLEDLRRKEEGIEAGLEELRCRERVITKKRDLRVVKKRQEGNNGGSVGRNLRGLSKMIELKLKEGWGVVGSKAIEGKKEFREDFREMVLEKRVINERRKRVKLRNEVVELVEKQMSDNVGSFEQKVKELEEGCQGVERKHCLTMELREKKLNEGFEVIKAKAKHLDAQRKKLEFKKREFSVHHQKLEAREKNINKRRKAFDLREKELDERCEARASKEKEIDEKWRALELKEKGISERGQALEVLEKQLNQRCESLKLQEKEVSSIYKAKVVIDKELRENLKALESKEKQLSDAGNKNLGFQVYESGEQILRLCNAMSGKTLQMFVNERLMEHHSMMENLGNALKLSNDPAKLVLSAVYGFFPPHLDRGGGLVFDTRAVRTSCMVFLENLMNMKASISEAVMNEAIKVASQWREGMVAEGMTSVVVLGFLLFLAAYDLGPQYKAAELQGLYGAIDQHRLAPQIALRLGLSNPKNDPQSNSKDSIKPPGLEKHPSVNSDQMFIIPCHPMNPVYGPPANGVPFQYQYPGWPHRPIPAPAACNCIPPYWCSWCQPLPYPYPHFSQ